MKNFKKCRFYVCEKEIGEFVHDENADESLAFCLVRDFFSPCNEACEDFEEEGCEHKTLQICKACELETLCSECGVCVLCKENLGGEKMKNRKKFRWLDSYYNDGNGLQIETKEADFVTQTIKQNGNKTIRVNLYAGEFLDVAEHVAEKTKFGEYVNIYKIDYQKESFELVAYAEAEVDGKLKQKMVVWDMKKSKLVEAYINAEDSETKIYDENFDNFGYINEEKTCSYLVANCRG